MDYAPIDRHLCSMGLIMDMLHVPAQPSFLYQMIAKLPQELVEVLFCPRIVCTQLLPYNLAVLDQVGRAYIRRVISTTEPSAQVAALDHLRHTCLVKGLDPAVHQAKVVLN